jgi:hypothetical protein
MIEKARMAWTETMNDILHDDDYRIIFSTSHRVQQALAQKKIFCNLHSDKLTVPKTARISPYSQFNICFELHTMGTGSYTMGPTTGLEVGSYCSLAGGLIVLGERHPIEDVTASVIVYDYGKPHFQAMYKDFAVEPARLAKQIPSFGAPPILEHDVWIGQNVILARGITLGTGSVVAGGSVVVKNVEPYTIVGGNPARVIRTRFKEGISRRLIDSKWWTIHPGQLLSWLKLQKPEPFLDMVDAAEQAGTLQRYDASPATAESIAIAVRSAGAAP